MDLQEILESHEKWLYGEGGEKANLIGADLKGADLEGANLKRADLRGAYLKGANLEGANLPHFQICPEEGSFVGWKKVQHKVIKLLIPEGAARTSSLVGRKCRASAATCIEVEGHHYQKGEVIGYSWGNFEWTFGEEIIPDSYDPDIRIECTHGIHFFMTRREAEEWS